MGKILCVRGKKILYLCPPKILFWQLGRSGLALSKEEFEAEEECQYCMNELWPVEVVSMLDLEETHQLVKMICCGQVYHKYIVLMISHNLNKVSIRVCMFLWLQKKLECMVCGSSRGPPLM